ncbi:hypothetical protein [Jidongwangia harbinensis]|uniref:hypothetical protein n=1 Tax=Jidongwangia harbinensis TaxID=2878561 RepID=UPI001CD9E668|nr:hypothetical protein [Jidongwangia harbinensis]MCA2215931.1 hypothetical protein [Jidongwangia harbinensis]
MESRRNRWLYSVGAAAACVAVISAGTVVANAAHTDGGGAIAFGAAAPAPSAPADRPGAPEEADPESRTPLGTPVDTGLPAAEGRYVLYAVAVDSADLPKTTFGVMLGSRRADGTLTAEVMANEVVGPDDAPGFHAVQGANGPGQPTFGYYAGPVTRITAKHGGKTVTAKLARWSEDPRVSFFWFAPTGKQLTGLTAYDAKGTKLPAGHNGVGVG